VLTAPVVRVLEDYLHGRTTGPLFITKTGKRMGQPEAWRMMRRLARRASLNGAGRACLNGAGEIRPRSLRVAFITGAREAGVPLEDVQDAAGHADLRTTRRYDRGGTLSTVTPRTRSQPGLTVTFNTGESWPYCHTHLQR
jgi:integrase/recombinase XerD